MARREIGTRWDRENRNNINENFKELYDVQDRAIEEATQAIVDSAKLVWLEPVNTYADIATTYPNPEVGHTVFVRDTGKVYRFYNDIWGEIQQIDAGPVNEIDTRLSTKIEENRQEIEQARTKADGTSFPLLKDRLNEVDAQLAQTAKKIRGIKLKDLEEPFYICHRGAKNIYPESSIEAYRGCVSMGLNIIELDVRLNADGVLVVNHDSTMDRTTNRLGLVTNYSTMGFKYAKITDLQNFIGTPATLEDVLLEFKQNAIYVIETKERNIDKSVVDMILKYNLEENCIIQSFNINDLIYAVEKGLPGMYLTDTEDPAVIKSAGIKYVGVSTSVTNQYIESCVQYGLKVIVYTVNRRYEHDHFLGLGVSGFFTDDPMYISRKASPLKKDPFINQTFHHGMIPNYLNYRGGFIEPNKWGFLNTKSDSDGRDFVLQGWAGELPDTFTLTYEMTIEENVTPGWGSIAFCTPIDYFDDNKTNLSEGYHALIGLGGTLNLYLIENGTATKLGEAGSTSIEEGKPVRLQIEVSSSSVKFKRLDDESGATVSVNNSVFRRGYFHFGRRWLNASFSNVVISN